MVPFSCALFPQNCSIKLSTIKKLEPVSYEKMKTDHKDNLPEYAYFNKGL